MSKIVVRMAEEADNDGIMALARKCPQHGMITFLFNRTPRFNTINRLLDPESWHYVACEGDRVVGVIGVINYQARVLGQQRNTAYIHDLLLDEKYRRGTTAFRMVKPVIDLLYQANKELVLVNFLKDNHHSLVFAKGRAGIPPAVFLGDNLFYSMLSLHKMRLTNRFEICQPVEEDIPELIEVYHRCSQAYKVAEIISEAQFRHYVSNITGLGLDNFLVAKRDGQIKAVTALWDELPYRNYEVQKLNFGITAITNTLKVLRLFMRVPQPIQLNKPLSQLSLVMNAHDECPEALDDLFRHVNNINRGSKYTLITMYAQQNDPMMKVIQKFKGMSVKSELHAFSPDPGLLEQLKDDPSPVMFNLALMQ